MSTLERLVTGIVRRLMKVQSFTGKVVSVDKDANTCVVDVDGLEKADVRLTSVVDAAQQKLIIYPSVDSQVTLGILENDAQQCYVAKYGVVDEISLETETDISVTCKGNLSVWVDGDLDIQRDGMTFNMSANGFLLEKSNETLYDIMNDLLTELQAATYANGAGATGPALNVANFAALQARIPNLLTS